MGQERLAARLRPTRVAMAIVITKPPTINGSHVSMPVRAVVRTPVVGAAALAAVLLELVAVFELEFEFELELEFDCAAATPASDSVMRTPRKTPAIARRANAPVVRTSSLSPKRVGEWTEVSVSTPGIPAPPADELRGHPSRHPMTCKVSRDPTQAVALPRGPGQWHHSRR